MIYKAIQSDQEYVIYVAVYSKRLAGGVYNYTKCFYFCSCMKDEVPCGCI